MEEQAIKKSLLQSIDAIKAINNSPGETTDKITETKRFTYFRIKDNQIPAAIKFTPAIWPRILLTLLASGAFAWLFIFILGHEFAPFDFFLSILFILLIYYLWFRRNILTYLIIDNQGINYTGDLYPWQDILTTHLEYYHYYWDSNPGLGWAFQIRSPSRTEIYLLLGLKDGLIRRLDISPLIFSGFLGNSYLIAGHYIEVFKARYNMTIEK